LYGQAGVLITQLREADVNIPFLSGSGTFFQALIDTAGNHVTGVYLAYGPDYKNLPSARHFLEAYHNKYGPEGSYSIYGYDAANVICRGIESAGTLDPTAVTAAIRRLTFQGALGPEEFDEKGDLKKSNLAMWTIQDGQFKLVP